jgi:hypothetical protein
MKILTEYSKHKYDFTIKHREGNIAIAYGKHRIHEHDNWEIIRIRSHNGLQMGDNFVSPAEFGPSDREWGVHGFTALNEQHAFEIFNRLKSTPNQ